MIKSLATVLISTTLALAMPASAHTEEFFDSHVAPHGGQMRMAGPYHLELVTNEKEIVLYVADHADKKISTEGAVGKATVQIGKAKPKTSIKLEPDGDNVLKGTGDFTVTPETDFVVFIKLPEQEAQSARFSPLKLAKKPHGDKASEPHHEQAGHVGHGAHGNHNNHGGQGKQGNSGGHDHHMHH